MQQTVRPTVMTKELLTSSEFLSSFHFLFFHKLSNNHIMITCKHSISLTNMLSHDWKIPFIFEITFYQRRFQLKLTVSRTHLTRLK